MRYIGNKTRLLPFLRRTLRRLGLRPGHAHDAFAGTASVGRALKEDGWVVTSSDIMTYSYVLQRAYVVASKVSSFRRVAAEDDGVRAALRAHRTRAPNAGRPGAMFALAEYLASSIPPEQGFVSRQFAPAGGRMYFTDENAARIDAARHTLHRWRQRGLIDEDDYYLLLAGIIEGADRVANTAGVYAAYIKKWQPNAVRPFTIVPEPPVRGGRKATARLADATSVAHALGEIDLLYIDPPYNTRQYSGYYHVPEILARGWFDGPVEIRGKTGLLTERSQQSLWCSRRGAPRALRELLGASGARHVLVSYNTEGVIPDQELRAILRAASVDTRVRRFTTAYKRYRADSDREGRRYKGDSVREILYYARLR